VQRRLTRPGTKLVLPMVPTRPFLMNIPSALLGIARALREKPIGEGRRLGLRKVKNDKEHPTKTLVKRTLKLISPTTLVLAPMVLGPITLFRTPTLLPQRRGPSLHA